MKVIVLGGGPGGYVCAIRLAQNGAGVTLVEREHLGGACLNVGCIPTKALLHSAQVYRSAAVEAEESGVDVDGVRVNWTNVQKRRQMIINRLVGGVDGLLRANGVKVIAGEGKLGAGKTLEVTADGKTETLSYDALVLATGMEPKLLPIPGMDCRGVLTSTEALSLESQPERMCIIGGGVIGCEFASIMAALGTKVTLIEALPGLLTGTDEDVVAVVTGRMKELGVDVHTGASVKEVREAGEGVEVFYNDTSVKADCVLVATGRRPVTGGLGLEAAGVKSERGFITVDRATMQTSVPGIYAIGDCNGGIQLAHVASAEGMVAADTICGKKPTVNFAAVPCCTYTMPEVAVVGLTEKQAAEQGHRVQTGSFSLAGNGKALIEGDTAGLVKFVADADTGEVLGLHIVGPRATDMIAEGTLAIDLECTMDEIADAIHAHPTVSEAVQEAAHAVFGNPIHMPPKRR